MLRRLASPWMMSVAVVALLALVIRLVGFPGIPVSVYWDEMAIWNDALSVAQTGRDLHGRHWLQALFISYGDFKQPVAIWLTAFVAHWVSDPLLGVRLPSLFAGVSMVPALAWLTWSLTQFTPQLKMRAKQVWPILSVLVLAVLPWSVHFSRLGYEGHLSVAFLLWSLACLLAGWHRHKRSVQVSLGVFSSAFGILAVYSYFSTRFVWPVVVATAAVLWWRYWRQQWWILVLVVVVWVLGLVPMYRADFYQASNQYRLSTANVLTQPDLPHEVNAWRERAGNTFLARVVYNRYSFVARDLAKNAAAHLDPGYLFWHGEDNARHSLGTVGLVYPVFLPFLVIGMVALTRRSWRLSVWLAVWWLVALVPASVPLDVPHALRSLNALPVLPILIGWGLWESWQWWQHQTTDWPRPLWWRRGAVGVLAAVLIVCVLRMLFTLVVIYPTASAEEWQDGYLQLADYVAEVRGDYTFVYVDNFDARFFLYYQPQADLTWIEIQQLPSKGFHRDTFKNVVIRDVDDWNALEKNSLVITRADRVPDAYEQPITDTIYGAAGKEEFVSLETPRD